MADFYARENGTGSLGILTVDSFPGRAISEFAVSLNASDYFHQLVLRLHSLYKVSRSCTGRNVILKVRYRFGYNY